MPAIEKIKGVTEYEFQQSQYYPECPRVPMRTCLVSGSGGGFQKSGDMPSLGTHPSAAAFQDEYGFFAVRASATTMTLSMVGEHGERPYNATLTSTTMG